MKKKFTIVLAHYNQMHYIKEALYSILNQDYERIELIITDDFSEKFDEESITNFIEKYKNNNLENYTFIKNTKNLGTVKTLNKAIKIATGDYILFFASDDKLYNKSVISNFVKCFNEKEKVITAQCIMCDNHLTNYYEKYVNVNNAIENNNKSSKELFEIMAENCIYSAGATAYDIEILKKYDSFDEKYKLIEDWSFWLKILYNGEKIYFHNFNALMHRDGGVSHYNKKKKLPPHVIQYYKDLLNAYMNEVMPHINELSEKNKINIISKYIFSLKIFSERSKDIATEFYEEKLCFFDKYNINENKYKNEIETINRKRKRKEFLHNDFKYKIRKPFKTNKILKFAIIENLLLCDIFEQYIGLGKYFIIYLIIGIIPLYYILNEIDKQDYIVNDAIIISSLIMVSLVRFLNNSLTIYLLFISITIFIYYILYLFFNIRKEK